MTSVSHEREATPLYINTLRNFGDHKGNVPSQSGHDCGRYEVLQKLITSSQFSSTTGYEVEFAEIESCLEQFVGPDGSVLWRRVVVRSGPSSPRQVIHASYMLPQDSSFAPKSSDDSYPSTLCWTSFPDRPDHPLLCVLANPTLLCIWDVYPSPSYSSKQSHQSSESDAKVIESEELGGGEGYNIALPFEACAIYGVGNGEHGLLLQRSESTEDIIAYNNKTSADDEAFNLEPNHDDDGFILKPPPRPVRLRDSAGGSTSLASLNVSTATTPTMMGNGGVGESAENALLSSSSMVPTLFSLYHPQGDILPISIFTQGDQMAAFTDVFEKILYTGVVKWVDEKHRASPRDRKQRLQPICVTYNSQLRRHAIWEIKQTPPPPPQAPLWQVSRQWRSKNGWDSHLGVLQQDLEDFELIGNPGGDIDTSRYDAASRNDALADALGVRRTTPRNGAVTANINTDNHTTTNKTSRTSGVGAVATMSNRNSKAKNTTNVSLLSPLSRQGNESNTLEVDTSIQDQGTSLTRSGMFGSLHPKTSMVCIHMDPTSLPPADTIFLASNTSGSGTLSLCLVCPCGNGTLPTPTNPKQLTVFSLTPIFDSGSKQNGFELSSGVRQRFRVQSEGTVPCVTAQPIEASPIPKNYEPHRTNRDNAWTGMATDILLLRNYAPDKCRLSLYRNIHHIVDCTISTDYDSSSAPGHFEEQQYTRIFNLKNSCRNMIDIAFMDNQGNGQSLRGKVSLILHQSSFGEELIQTVEAAFENIGGLDALALKTRADCVRLEHSHSHVKDSGADIAKIVILSLLRFDILGININEFNTDMIVNESLETKKTSWEMLLECSDEEPYSFEYQDLFDKTSSMINEGRVSSKSRHVCSADLSNICSLAVDHLEASESSIATTLFDTIHLLHEEMKLHRCKQDEGVRYTGSLLRDICLMASRNGTISDDLSAEFFSYYSLDLDSNVETSELTRSHAQPENLKRRHDFRISSFARPPSILTWIEENICGDSTSSLFSDLNRSDLNTTCTRMQSFLRIFPSLWKSNECNSALSLSKDFEVLQILLEEGFSDPEALRDELPVGISLPLLELIHRCRTSELGSVNNVDPNVWSLIGRGDMTKKISDLANGEISSPPVTTTYSSSRYMPHRADDSENNDKDGILQLELTSSMLFPDDNRIREAGRLLRSSKPSYLHVPRAIEVSDHDYERQKQEKLLLLSRRILALPLGRGMLTIGNLKPVPAEPLPLPDLCLSGRVPPTNTSMALDVTECPVDMKVWPEFHNGVAAGLRLPLQLEAGESVTKITRTWIVYNRPSSSSGAESQNNATPSESNSQGQNHAHGGLLMALGMRGHLTTLEMTDIFDYLTHGSVTTTIGCLLGMAANMRGSCDISVSKMLCLHIPSLIPQHFSTIDVASTVQAAAVAGAGLLYEGSSHRMMTEFLLNEIGKRPSNDGNVLDREAYTLACGIALGMVNLCKGSENNIDSGAGLADLRIEERLYRYIVGGLDDAEMRRRYEESDRLSLPPISSSNTADKCSCVYEGDSINIDVTAPGATLALGLMYMKSGNKTIASAIALPDTHFLLEYVRPDFLMFRVIARAMIMWNEVEATDEWIQAQIPKAALTAYKEMKKLAESIQRGDTAVMNDDKDYDRQAVRYIYTHVVSAACFSIGLRFAGTGNTDAASVIFERVMELRELRDAANPISAALRPPTPVLEMCLGCAAISLSMVLAGTGNLDALRLLKILRWPCTDDVSFGNHQAYGTAIGLLFLGGGSCTLGRDPKDIAALIMAFFPRFPSSTSDNQYHLQALRNLYALAVKRRELKAIDVDTGECVFAPIEVHFPSESLGPLHLTAPCLLVNTDEMPSKLQVVSKQHYPLTVALENNFGNKTFYVKRRSSHMYGERPHFHTSLTQMSNLQKRDSLELISSFTDDQRVVAFANHFCDFCQPQTRKHNSGQSVAEFCSRILHECFLRDTQQALPLYLALRSAISIVDRGYNTRVADAWDFRLIRSYYQEGGLGFRGRKPHGLLNCEIFAYLIELLEYSLSHENSNNRLLSVFHASSHNDRNKKSVADEMDVS